MKTKFVGVFSFLPNSVSSVAPVRGITSRKPEVYRLMREGKRKREGEKGEGRSKIRLFVSVIMGASL